MFLSVLIHFGVLQLVGSCKLGDEGLFHQKGGGLMHWLNSRLQWQLLISPCLPGVLLRSLIQNLLNKLSPLNSFLCSNHFSAEILKVFSFHC